jgi:hypothetical protein
MTEEELDALLKLEGKGLRVEIKTSVVYTVELQNEKGQAVGWASSEQEDMAIETLARQYFGGE